MISDEEFINNIKKTQTAMSLSAKKRFMGRVGKWTKGKYTGYHFRVTSVYTCYGGGVSISTQTINKRNTDFLSPNSSTHFTSDPLSEAIEWVEDDGSFPLGINYTRWLEKTLPPKVEKDGVLL